MDVKYSWYKPKSCEYCYFWNLRKKKCSKKECHYLIPEKKTITMCGGCPYGRIKPCIGWCTMLILKK